MSPVQCPARLCISAVGGAIRSRWNSAIFRTLENHPVAKAPWSAIRCIGQPRVLALTVIVPFLGSIILFNHTVIERFLSLSLRSWFATGSI